MCFCAEASFTISTLLAIVGISTIKKVSERSLYAIAAIPLLFAVQQFAEGIVWLYVNNDVFESTTISLASKNIYLLFAWIIWPVYVPCAFLFVENIRWKQMITLLCLLMGIYISIHDIYYLSTVEVNVVVREFSIFYDGGPFVGRIFYGMATLLPIFISSLRRVWIFGIWLTISFAASEIIFSQAFTSVWCFFAAAISVVLARILLQAQKQKRSSYQFSDS